MDSSYSQLPKYLEIMQQKPHNTQNLDPDSKEEHEWY